MKTTDKLTRRAFLQAMAFAASAAASDWSGLGALAGQIDNKKKFPVVIIGAGLGGLVSGAYLSKFGFDVTILEQHHIPGGYATAFDRGEFTFDVSLHATVAEHGIPQKILSDLGIWDRLNMVYTPELRRIVTDRFDVTLPARNPEGVIRVLSDTFPEESHGIEKFYGQMKQVAESLFTGQGPGRSTMIKLSDLSLAQWMDMHVKNPEARSCLAAFSGYYGLPPEQINALFYAIATGQYLVHGGQYYKTRSQDLSNALAQSIETFGGQLRFNTCADRILFDRKKAVSGVRDRQGKIYPAKAVIANCPVPALVDAMISPKLVPESFRRQAGQRQISLSSFVIWLGLDQTLPRIRDYEIDLAGSRRTGSSPDILDDLEDPDRTGVSITLYDNLYKGYSSPGKTTMSIMCLAAYAPWKKFEADYFNNRKETYQAQKEKIAAAFIQRVEKKLIPGLSGMVEVMEIGTPLTNVFYTGNTEGAIYGYDRNLPHLESRTPVTGLYLAGAWSHGGGYTPVMMGGEKTARNLLEDFLATGD